MLRYCGDVPSGTSVLSEVTLRSDGPAFTCVNGDVAKETGVSFVYGGTPFTTALPARVIPEPLSQSSLILGTGVYTEPLTTTWSLNLALPLTAMSPRIFAWV